MVTTLTSCAKSAAPASDQASAKPSRPWKAGTLTYTFGGLVVIFFWLLCGDFAWSMRDRSVGPMSQWYLNHLKVPNLLFGLLMISFPAFVGMILAPIISVKSDRHRGRWGRRIPFLLATTPIAALGMIGIGLTPILAQQVHRLFPGQSETVVAVVCFGVFWAVFEFAAVAAQPVFNGLINDVVPKSLLGRFYGLFRAVSLIDGMIFNYWIMGKVPEHFTLILCIIGVFYGTAFMWVCLKVKEGDYPPPAPRPPSSTHTGINGFWRGFFRETKCYLKECFNNPYYLSIFILVMIAQLSFLPINTFAIPYARSLGVDMETYGKYLAMTFSISLGLSFFLGWAADAFHPLRMTIGTLICYAVAMTWGRLYATTPETFLAAWVAHGVLSGCFYTCVASLAQRLFPHSRFAQFASAAGMCTAFANMSLAPCVGLLIDKTGGVFRHTFAIGATLAALALVAGFYVHGKFMKLGGPKKYVAPE